MESSKRISFLDNFKGFLIFLVVFAHFLFNFTPSGYEKYIVDIIYFFHMPAFIFISGYFSKKDISFKKALKYILIYAIFNTIFVAYHVVSAKTFLVFTPFYSYWYLLALVAWRIIAKYIPCNKWYIMIPASFVIALISGFFSDISNILAFKKILGFLPFFFIGYYLPKNFIISFLDKRKKWVMVLGFFIFLLALLGAFYISYSFDILDCLLMNPYTTPIDFFIRVLIYVIALVFIFGLFCMVPKGTGKYNFIEKWGKNSLWIYVFHRPITLIFAKIYPGPDNLYMFVSIIISIIICFLFGSNKLSAFLNKFLDKIVDSLDKERISSHLLQNNKSTNK